MRIAHKRSAGILTPLFSVYSNNSLGIGELEDIKLVVDWCNKTGNSILQLLPLNEVGTLFCPYDALSSFALEPAYISLRLIPGASKKNIQEKIKKADALFPKGRPRVDYAIKKEKMDLLWGIFCVEDPRRDERFRKFTEDNNYWLDDFALYKVLKKYSGEEAWYDWQDCYKNRDSQKIAAFRALHDKEIIFQMWVQWHLYRQLKGVKEYAVSKNVLIKGDLPLLVSKDSADVWAHPEFFKLEFAAGAPPDMYCAKGQRWGMPTYNWEKISDRGFRYLKEKLKIAENYYDLLRIDHVVGLFRIWSIPSNEPLVNKGLNGFFDPRDEALWKKHGKNILSVILHNTHMALCAEDLGIIPRLCPETLKELGIPGNDVQRWTKDWQVKHDFLAPEDYRNLSIAMLSTHDTTNWPAWWENEAGTVDEALFIRKCSERKIDYDRLKTELFDLSSSGHGRLRWLNSIVSPDMLVHILGKRAEEVGDFIDMYKDTYREKEKLWKLLKLSGPMREKCDHEIIKAALRITLSSEAVYCIETIIDWLYLADMFKGDPYQYRINTPGTISDKNWSLTIPVSLEDLLKHRVNREIKELIASAGRI